MNNAGLIQKTALVTILAFVTSCSQNKENIESEFDCLSAAKSLYSELLEIKSSPSFNNNGFGSEQGKEWKNKYEILRNQNCDQLLMSELGIVTGDLETLANTYLSQNGKEDEYTSFIGSKFITNDSPIKSEAKAKLTSSIEKTTLGIWKLYLKSRQNDFITLEIFSENGSFYYSKDGSKGKVLALFDGKLHIPNNKYGEYYIIEGNTLKMFDSEGDLAEADWRTEYIGE